MQYCAGTRGYLQARPARCGSCASLPRAVSAQRDALCDVVRLSSRVQRDHAAMCRRFNASASVILRPSPAGSPLQTFVFDTTTSFILQPSSGLCLVRLRWLCPLEQSLVADPGLAQHGAVGDVRPPQHRPGVDRPGKLGLDLPHHIPGGFVLLCEMSASDSLFSGLCLTADQQWPLPTL